MKAVLHWGACLECNQAHSKELNKCTALVMLPLNVNSPGFDSDYCLSIAFLRRVALPITNDKCIDDVKADKH